MKLVKFYVSKDIVDLRKQQEDFEEWMLNYTTLECHSTFDEYNRMWVVFCKYYIEDWK